MAKRSGGFGRVGGDVCACGPHVGAVGLMSWPMARLLGHVRMQRGVASVLIGITLHSTLFA
jgi:hypothetical protein